MLKTKYDKKNKIRPVGEQTKRRISLSSESSSLILINPNKLKKYKSKKKRIIESEDLSILPDDQKKSKYISIFKDKLKVVDGFFNNKLDEFEVELNRIDNKMNLLENSSSETSGVGTKRSEYDEFSYAVSWKRALSALYNQTSWLHSYHSVNSLAVLKIKKKAIKIFNLNNIKIDKKLNKNNLKYKIYKEYLYK